MPFVASFCQVSEQEVEANFSLVGGSTKNWAFLGLIPSPPLSSVKGRMQQWALWGGAVRKYQYASHLSAEVFFKLDIKQRGREGSGHE